MNHKKFVLVLIIFSFLLHPLQNQGITQKHIPKLILKLFLGTGSAFFFINAIIFNAEMQVYQRYINNALDQGQPTECWQNSYNENEKKEEIIS